ncbi:unnamed protein product [Triticum turgidum subsp. durum]|uniref:Exportin-1/Importin-beta-like domain-containing protein n=1 Tax=Triticum turgidum subsp. durum TaxID=4567 RepID=A0A9R0WBB8_TRITD|nr:unnamed protein product [Triticum turgidum subsp. durum]
MDVAESPDLQAQLAAAVHALNHASHPSARLAANQWLVGLQRSPQAWALAVSLLASADHPSPSADLLFFAAQMLRRKIQSPDYSLPDNAAQLLDALLVAARRFCLAPPRLLTQICLALAALALRAEGGVDGLFARMPHLPDPALLELLTVLPEEVAQDESGDTGVDSATRCRFTRELLTHAPAVLEFLLAQSEKPAAADGVPLHERNHRILRCLLSWVRAGCFSGAPVSALVAHPLLTFAFNSLQAFFSFEVAIEVMTELVSQYQAPGLVAEGSNEALSLSDALLRCVAFSSEDWEIAESTLQFWCSLAHCILGIDEQTSKRNATQELFLPVFSSLLDALLFRAQIIDIDEHCTGRASSIPDGLVQFRLNLEELLVDICLLLGAPAYINKLLSSGWGLASQSIPWKEVEVRMYALSMVADTILQDGSPFDFSVVMHFVNILSSRTPAELNGCQFLVYKSFGDVIGSYSKWLSSSKSNIKPLLLFCASGISKSISSNSCSVALRKLCEDASSFIHEPPILDILFWISEGMGEGNLRIEDEEEIISAITHALCSILDKELRKTSLARLLCSSYSAVEKIIDIDRDELLRQNSCAYAQALNIAVRGLHRGALFSHLAMSITSGLIDDDTISVLFGIFWPLLEKLSQSSHMENTSLSTAACRSLSSAIHSCGQHFQILLPKILECLSMNFLLYQRHDCFLRTAANMIEEFGHKEEYSVVCVRTIETFSSAASLSNLNSSYTCDQEPDLIEAYANFTSAFIRCCPKEAIVASRSLLELSFQKAAICSTAMHRGAALAAISYMSCFFDASLTDVLESPECPSDESRGAVLVQILARCGEGLMSNVFYALLGVSALSRVHKSATMLQQLAALCSLCERTMWKGILCWDSLCGWLQTTVLQDAASDYLHSRTGDNCRNHPGYMQGKGGRTLKRVIRDFAESHRNVPTPYIDSRWSCHQQLS